MKNTVQYACRNCNASVEYMFFFSEDAASWAVFTKVGQYPELEVEPPRSVAQGECFRGYRRKMFG